MPYINSLLISDFNHDGISDIAVSQDVVSNAAYYTIFKGRKDGSFEEKIEVPSPSGARIIRYLKSADFNGDKIPDLFSTDELWPPKGSLLIGNGDFSFTYETGTSIPTGNYNSLIGDFNNDGKPDILNASGEIYLNETTFPPPPQPLNLDDIDELLATISKERANIGASISALTFTVDNLTTLSTKTQEAMSRIQDTDYAVATTELAKRQIIQQAAMAMMAQANQNPQVILQLLKSITS